MPGDYYRLLGIAEQATPEQIRRAYYAMVRLYPPEKEPERFMALRQAFETLGDPARRREYDRRCKVTALKEEAYQHLAAEEWEQVVGLLQRIAGLIPDDPDVHFGLGQAYSRMGRPEPALVSLERALTAESQPAEKRMQILFFVLHSTVLLEYDRHPDLWTAVWGARARGASALANVPSVQAVVGRMMSLLQQCPPWTGYEIAADLLQVVADDLGVYADPGTVLYLEAILRIDPDHTQAARFLAECTARVAGSGKANAAASDLQWVVPVCAVLGAAAGGPKGLLGGLALGYWLRSYYE